LTVKQQGNVTDDGISPSATFPSVFRAVSLAVRT